ncbi:hypothetical protein [Methyloglobulus sp.]
MNNMLSMANALSIKKFITPESMLLTMLITVIQTPTMTDEFGNM